MGGSESTASPIRARIAKLCAWLGVRLDSDANASGTGQISHPDSAVRVLVIPTDEQAIIAHGVTQVLAELP